MSNPVQVSAQPVSDGKARLLGALTLAAGIALCWFFGWLPLMQAQAHAAKIEYSPKLFIVGPMMLACGTVLLVGGRLVSQAMLTPPRTRQQHLIVWPTLGLAMAAGAVAWICYDLKLRSLGYVVG